MFKLDKQNRNPKYEQLTEKIKVKILSNMISPNTVQRSYYELENQGYLYSIKGKGYYVASINVFSSEVLIGFSTVVVMIAGLLGRPYVGLGAGVITGIYLAFMGGEAWITSPNKKIMFIMIHECKKLYKQS
ncbi:LytS/YhcK type 5TM receptor domain-containing protein [Gracilibacillus kekensis]|uniref:5TMR of 5TMR-LYT n=1 Tax=Gracilibacillus kekensis TaxID=1027249 RepID=A0A1M7Q6P9_9BACI|nr:LytS/YhcK type 5TM receptor domain-containing protein [Gracilibacillus kekensis]SHN26184.1 5TMR of 5TMR-LYT [Gracilibacillus kekensis]